MRNMWNTKVGHRGATLTDYGILAGLLGAVAIGSILYLGTETTEVFETANAGVEAGAARGKGNGPGGGNNGNGGGNGGNNACLQDTAGNDAISGGDLLNNCVEISTGTDNLDLSGSASGARVVMDPNVAGSYTEITGGSNVELVIPASRDGFFELFLAPGGATIRFEGRNLADMGIARETIGAHVIFASVTAGVNDTELMVYIRDMFATASWSPSSYTLVFDDQTLTSADIRGMVLEMRANNLGVPGTPLDDTIQVRCSEPFHDGSSNLEYSLMYTAHQGDDTFLYTSGSGRFYGGDGNDTLDLSMFASGDVTFTTAPFEHDVQAALPNGQHLLLLGWGPNGTGADIESLVFSDTTLTPTDVSALWTGPEPLSLGITCSPAWPGPAYGDRVGGPSGPIEVEQNLGG